MNCVRCGAEIPRTGKAGRPRLYCDACRSPKMPPDKSEVLNQLQDLKHSTKSPSVLEPASKSQERKTQLPPEPPYPDEDF